MIKPEELREKQYLGYIVREDGTIFSKKKKVGKMLFSLSEQGYPSVSLSYKGKAYYRRVHRILAELFIPNPENKPCVNHKDRNRANYSLDNLEWCTHSENAIHSVENGGRINWTRDNLGEKNPNSKLNYKTVQEIRRLNQKGVYNQREISEIFNIKQCQVSKIVNRKAWNSKELTLKK